MKRLSTIILAVSVVVAGFALASCGDDDNDDNTTVQNAIAQSYAGQYAGTDSLNVRMAVVSWGYNTASPVTYTITANSDGTVRLTMPEETYTDTQIGDITIGSYSIDSLKYNILTGYTRAYKGTNAKVHFRSTGGVNYPIVLNDDYAFKSSECFVRVSRQADGSIRVENAYILGNSPVLITNTFAGRKQ